MLPHHFCLAISVRLNLSTKFDFFDSLFLQSQRLVKGTPKTHLTQAQSQWGEKFQQQKQEQKQNKTLF